MRLTKRYKNGAVTVDADAFGADQGVLDSEIGSSKPIKAAVARLAEMEDRLPYNAECGNCKNCTQGEVVYDRYCEELERNCYTMSFCSYYEEAEQALKARETRMSLNQQKQIEKPKEITLKYKIRMVVDIEGEIECQPPLKEDTGIYPFMQWAMDDIESRLECECDIVDVKAVELKEVES